MVAQFKVGLVGAGYVSQFHVAALQRLKNIQIVGICDCDEPRAKTAAEQYGLKAYSSLAQLCEAGAEVLHILTPPATHAELTLEALAADCHVLVEKPLATSVADCRRIAAASNAMRKTVCVNHSLLRDPFITRALRLVHAGSIGDVVAVDWLRSSFYPPYRGGALPPQYRDGGYPFRDLGVHGLYLLQEILGEIQNVVAQFDNAGPRSSDMNIFYDEWRSVARCARGYGQLQISWNARPIQNTLIIQGSRGAIRADLFGMNVTTKRSTLLPKSLERAFNAMNEGRQICTQVPVNLVRFASRRLLPYHGLQMLVAEFYENLASGKSAPVTPEHACPIVRWTEQVARPADAAKEEYLAAFPRELTAKILVTGASGFIGRALVKRLLAEGQRVRVFVRRAPTEWLRHPQVEIALGDLGDPEAVERAVGETDLIYHLGAATRGSAEDFQRATVVGTGNLIESALKRGVRNFVHVSSLSVLHAAAARADQRITEDWPLEPHPARRGSYTQTKLEAENLVMQAVKKRNLNAVVLRPGQVIGPGAPLITGAVAQRVGKRFLILGNGKLALPLVYVEDVVDALLLAAKNQQARGQIFHLVDPALRITQNELLAQYLEAMKQDAPKTHFAWPLLCSLALGVEVLGRILRRSVPISRYRIRSALAPMSFDCRAAEKQLGWKPRIGIAAGLKLTLAASVK